MASLATGFTWPSRFGSGCWADERDPGIVEFGFEAGSPVALVGHDDLAGSVQSGIERDHVERGVSLVGLGACEGVGDRKPCGGDDEMKS
jgi:hypothetical protein